MIRRFGTVKAREEVLTGSLTDTRSGKISSRVWRGFQFPASSCAEVTDAFSAAWPLLRKEKAAILLCERCRRRHEDTCMAPRMRIKRDIRASRIITCSSRRRETVLCQYYCRILSRTDAQKSAMPSYSTQVLYKVLQQILRGT